MKRLAVVFQSFVRAGSQRHLVEILKGIRLFRPELECTLFLIDAPRDAWGTFLPEIQQADISVINAPYVFQRKNDPSLISRLHDWLSRHYLERKLNQSFYRQLADFDTVVCAEFFVADLLLPNLHPRQRLCFHLMEHLAQRTDFAHYRLLRHPRLNLIFMHPSQIDQLPLKLTVDKTITWLVRLCPDHFHDPETTHPGNNRTLRISHYSRISPMRLIDQLIDAFSLLHEQTDCSLRIAGHIEDSAYHQRLLAQIERLGLRNAVSFAEPVPSPAEDPYRSSVDLVWMISLSSHIGYAGIESMAAGLPTLFLEVDARASISQPDPELASLICTRPQQLVERSLALKADPASFCRQQGQLVRDRFMTTQSGIDELIGFYLCSR
ncbi:MAG: glycosyltransferase [Cyanobacteriota bacterium]